MEHSFLDECMFKFILHLRPDFLHSTYTLQVNLGRGVQTVVRVDDAFGESTDLVAKLPGLVSKL